MALDDDDKKFIKDLLGEHGKQFVTIEAATKMVEQGVTKGLEGLKLDDKIKTAIDAAKPADDDKKKKADDDKKKTDDPEVNARLEELARKLEAEQSARKEAEQSAREQKLQSALGAALDKAGVPSARHAHAMAYLRTLTTEDGKPLVRITDDGKLVWSAQRKGYVDQLDLDAGAKEWVGSDDGKAFLPATNAQGTGEGAAKVATPRDPKGAVQWNQLGERLAAGLASADIADL